MKLRSFQNKQDTFSKNVQSISEFYHEILLLMKFLQTKPQVNKMNSIFYDLSYTVIKNKDENKVLNDKFEDIENDYLINNGIVFNHYIGRKNNNVKVEKI